ncbi:MAG: hypothetical protein KJ063_04680 [Anaerolineae bacterium]|nr:hypothetical protein [Anaerolineae bacterium]
MFKRTLPPFLLTLLLLTLVACGGGTSNEPDAVPTLIEPAALPTLSNDSYPAPIMPTPFNPDGYPGGLYPTIEVVSPYPGVTGQTIWILRPLGQQCMDPESHTYPNLAAAVTALTNAGVTVLEARDERLMVCEACDCPTPEHFRARINLSDYGKATPLGWYREN